MSTLTKAERKDKMVVLGELMVSKKIVQLNLGNDVSHRGHIIQLSLDGRVLINNLNKELTTCWASEIRSINTQPTIEKTGE